MVDNFRAHVVDNSWTVVQL